jgi:glyceraldehyde-3-phosphate dehydrogenase/erythrose-4-phosphate dehydrogenase
LYLTDPLGIGRIGKVLLDVLVERTDFSIGGIDDVKE